MEPGLAVDAPESAGPGAHGRAGAIFRVIGVLLVAYWGCHFVWHLQYWPLYADQARTNIFLGPVFRSTIDVLAVLAGVLAIRKSTWFFAPFLLHCLAHAWMFTSILASFTRAPLKLWMWGVLPLNVQLSFIAQFLVLAVTVYAALAARTRTPVAA